MAEGSGDVEILRLLIDAGATVDAVDVVSNCMDMTQKQNINIDEWGSRSEKYPYQFPHSCA